MALVVKTPNTTIATETTEIDSDTYIRVVRHRSPSVSAETQTTPYQKAMIWGESSLIASVRVLNSISSKRLVSRTLDTKINSTTSSSKGLLIPQPPPPTGSILYGGESLNGKTFCKGQSIPLQFSVTGWQVTGLTLVLKFSDLSESISVIKEVLLAPGIPQVLTLIPNADGSETYGGEIPLTPLDTIFAGTTSPLEIRYELVARNNSVRYYCLESGRVNFD